MLALGCSHRPAIQTAATPPGDPVDVRHAVRALAKNFCGTCHQASLPSAKPAALAIFNLDADDWWSTLTAARLRGGFTRRLESRLDSGELQLLRAFVEHEVALRTK